MSLEIAYETSPTPHVNGFQPSKYQQAIFDHQTTDGADGFVQAVAGSGKTSTICEAGRRLPPGDQGESLFVAFNKHIADELAARLPKAMTTSTIHALGMKALRGYFENPPREWIDGNKYKKLVRMYWRKEGMDYKESREYVDATNDLVRYAMLTLADLSSEAGLVEVASHFGVVYPGKMSSAFSAVKTILEWGLNGTPDGRYMGARESISFDDMVYLPNILGLKMRQYRRLYIDETQDLNAAQRELILKMRHPLFSQAFWVGDVRQAIYGFAGADVTSVETIKARTNAKELPLSICYRCPTRVLDLAREIVPEIEPRDGAPAGIVDTVYEDRLTTHLTVGDLVICRTVAPLVDLTFSLIGSGRSAIMRGRDIGQGLIRMVDAITDVDGYVWDSFLNCLYDYKDQVVQKLSVKAEDNEMAIESFSDRCHSVEKIYVHYCSKTSGATLEGFKAYIESLFSDTKGAITLSTIHKSKGLENDRVILLHPELMPHPRAKREWEIGQEQNLRYVALTRAKKELYFVAH